MFNIRDFLSPLRDTVGFAGLFHIPSNFLSFDVLNTNQIFGKT